MPTLQESSVDSVICDPPYGLDFMGKSWDHGVPGMEFWQAALRVAKPGAILMAFGGTRTFHRLACAIEDAGWEMRDTMCYLYGSGFPKSLDISKQIDKRGGAQVAWFGPWFRQWCYGRKITQNEVAALFPSKSGGMTGCVSNWELGLNMPTPDQFNLLCSVYGLPFKSIEEAEREVVGRGISGKTAIWNEEGTMGSFDITAPSTPAAHLWQGYGTALKPAWEPIIVAMKPPEGTYAENAQKWGVAGLNIDGGRIGTAADMNPNDFDDTKRTAPKFSNVFAGGKVEQCCERTGQVPNGRWPANLLLDEESAAQLDQMSGELTSGAVMHETDNHGKFYGGGYTPIRQVNSGGASRFFYTSKAPSEERPFFCNDCNAAFEASERWEHTHGHVDEKGKQTWFHIVTHPTQKPEDLMRYLCKLTRTPTGGVVLDPFMGSGTTGIACILEHRDFIGIEIDAKYAEIARKRIADMTGPLFVTA